MRSANKRLSGRIVLDPKVMAGKPLIKGTRLTVQFILGLLASGMTIDDVLKEYTNLERQDVLACLHYASEAMDHSAVLPVSVEA